MPYAPTPRFPRRTPLAVPFVPTMNDEIFPLPSVIPRPKQIEHAGRDTRPFRFTPRTRIVVGNQATAADKQGAELLRKAVAERFGRDVPLTRAADAAVVQADDVVAIGEPGRNPILDRLLAAERVAPPRQPEGYALAAGERAVLVAGRDPRGTFWGTQTLIQLLSGADPGAGAAPVVPPVRILDWPTLSIRAVHLFHGRDALSFHRRLIERVLSPFKMNALFLQAEQLRWDSDPAIAPAWAGRKEQVREEIRFARTRGITVYPLVQSMGHMEWLFAGGRNLAFAEDPETPYALNVSDPSALAHLGRILAEADELFGAPAFHVGLDEVVDVAGADTRRGRFPHRSAPATFAELFVRNARHWHDFFARRGKRMWMWADMALYKDDVAPSFGTAPTREDAARIRRELPKDIVMVDWQYSARPRYPSLTVLKEAGFPVVAATWYYPDGIRSFSRARRGRGARRDPDDLGRLRKQGKRAADRAPETVHRVRARRRLLLERRRRPGPGRPALLRRGRLRAAVAGAVGAYVSTGRSVSPIMGHAAPFEAGAAAVETIRKPDVRLIALTEFKNPDDVPGPPTRRSAPSS
jgi:hypothetical protein